MIIGIAEWALGFLELTLGKPDEATDRLLGLSTVERPESNALIGLWSVPDLIEAAARSGRLDEAGDRIDRYTRWAQHSSSPARRSVFARSRALMGEGDVQGTVREGACARGGVSPFLQARTELLYGEWLRRERQRREARQHLRRAAELFRQVGAPPWAERAEGELRATGETARRRDPSTLDELTPQELQIAGLVADGMTNRQIAAQLFLSPRTIDYHLRRSSASSAWRPAPSWCAWEYPSRNPPDASGRPEGRGAGSGTNRRSRLASSPMPFGALELILIGVSHATSPVEGRANQTQGARNEKQEPQFPSPELSGPRRRWSSPCRPVRGDGRLRLRGGEGQAEQCQDEEIKNAAVTTDKIADGAVTTPKLSPDAVAPNAANAAKLGGVAPGGCQTGWLKASLVVDTDVIPPDAGSAVVPGFDCASNAQDAVQIKRTDVGRYLVTFADNDAANAVITSAGDNAVTAVTKTADGFVVKVWNNSDAAFVDGKSFSLVAF